MSDLEISSPFDDGQIQTKSSSNSIVNIILFLLCCLCSCFILIFSSGGFSSFLYITKYTTKQPNYNTTPSSTASDKK